MPTRRRLVGDEAFEEYLVIREAPNFWTGYPPCRYVDSWPGMGFGTFGIPKGKACEEDRNAIEDEWRNRQTC